MQWWPVLSALVVVTASPLTALCYVLWRIRSQRPKVRSAAIVVLGDVGRSPRMMYHAESFAQAEFDTWIIGYQGSRPIPSLRSMRFLYVATPWGFIAHAPRALFPLVAPFKVLLQTVSLFSCLVFRLQHAPEFILVQNPPSIPTLAVVQAAALLRRSKLIIDWHNTGHSILTLKLGDSHALVALAKWFEGYFGRSAYAHLFVTHAMKDALVAEWGLQGDKVVLHDRPPAHFHPCEPQETHELLVRLFNDHPEELTMPNFLPHFDAPESTPLTRLVTTPPNSMDDISLQSVDSSADRTLTVLRPDRPAVLVSSTSWTADERIDLLFDALALYDAMPSNPKLLVLITGRGPLRAELMARAREMERGWTRVRVRSLWLEAEDYPRVLGAADVGVSLHASSSGLDLPMKVVDMFGCGLPVCALDFACLGELVQDGKNGRVFADAAQLAQQLTDLLAGFPRSATLLALRENLMRQRETWGTWSDNWNAHLRPLVRHDAQEQNTEKWLEGFAERHARGTVS